MRLILSLNKAYMIIVLTSIKCVKSEFLLDDSDIETYEDNDFNSSEYSSSKEIDQRVFPNRQVTDYDYKNFTNIPNSKFPDISAPLNNSNVLNSLKIENISYIISQEENELEKEGADEAFNETMEIITELFTESITESIRNTKSDLYPDEDIKKEIKDIRRNIPGSKTEYPYSVSIQKKGSHYASGALLSNQWVLTAASEFYNVRESIKLYNVRLGEIDCKKGQKIPVMMVEVNPSYKKGLPEFDLGMLKLAYKVKFSDSVRPIAISKKSGCTEYFTIYWPRLIVHGKLIPITASERTQHRSMRVRELQTIPWDTCSLKLRSQNVDLAESSRCVQQEESQCTPNVGAPVVSSDGLCGTISGWVAENCTMESSPMVFTALSEYNTEQWINEVLLYR